MSYKIAHVDEIGGIDYREDSFMRPVREHFGITAFGTNAWRGENVGDRLVPSHEEDPGNEELYVVLRGRARFEIDGDKVDAPAGTLVFCTPQANRTAFAEEPETAVLAVGSTVGQAYHGGGWEVWAPFHPQYEAGETVEASGHAAPLYNLACCEALAGGRVDDAIGHLRLAFEGRPGLRDMAKEDTDLDALRDEPAFQELVG